MLVSEYRWFYGEPDVIEVTQIFDTGEEAREFEEMVIEDANAVDDLRWLNRTNKGKDFFCEYHPSGWKHTDQAKEAMRLSKLGNRNPMFGKPNSAFQGHTHSELTKMRMSESHKGRKKSDAMRSRLSEYAKNHRLIVRCEYCGKETHINLYSRWHGNRCKEKT